MKNIVLKFTLLLCLFSFFTMNGQSTAPKTPKKHVRPRKDAAKAAVPPVNDLREKPVVLMPAMTFDKKYHDFGTIKTGDTPTLVFNFTNTGNANLDIDQVTHCDCTDVDWTRTTVEPGGKGFISMKFISSKAEPEEHKVKLQKFLDIILKQANPTNGYLLNESLKFDIFIAD
jgi:Protein of unknown function (DUF1573)